MFAHQLNQRLASFESLARYEAVATDLFEFIRLEEKRHLEAQRRQSGVSHDVSLSKKRSQHALSILRLRRKRTELKELMQTYEQHKMAATQAHQELDSARTELMALRDISQRSNSHLAEKLALSHENAALKTELKALSSVSAEASKNLAENLDLQRQLADLRLELDSERLTVQRLQQLHRSLSDNEASVKSEINGLRDQLERETALRKKSEQDMAKSASDWEAQEKLLLEKLESSKAKLRQLKQELVEKAGEVNQKKRGPSAAQLTMEDLEATTKKPRVKGPGPKVSEFSTTPFFKRHLTSGKAGGAPGDETVLDADDMQALESEITSWSDRALRHGARETPSSPAQITTEENPPNKRTGKSKSKIHQVSDPVAVPTTAPTKLLLAGVNKKKKGAPTTSTASTGNAGLKRSGRGAAILDEAFEDQLEDVIGGIKVVPNPASVSTSAPPRDMSAKDGGPSNEAKSKKPQRAQMTRKPNASKLFEDEDGSGRLAINLDALPVPTLGADVGILNRVISPAKKRPKGVGVKVGVGKKHK